MAFKSKLKKEKAKNLDLLPFMNLFAILIPFFTFSCCLRETGHP